MKPDVERARYELELARTEIARLQQEMTALGKTLDPARAVVHPSELRLMKQCSEWIDRRYAAEHAVFRAEHGTPCITGAHADYQWLTTVDHDITEFLRMCPEVVLHRFLAVTSIDSGALHLTGQEKSAGWWTAEQSRIYRSRLPEGREYRDDWKVAYSPLLDQIHGLPNETHDECCAGFDEWYVFERVAQVDEIETFVNWMGFRVYDPEWKWLVDRFWVQLAKVNAESYIADGTVLTFATRNASLFQRALSAMSEV